MTAREKSAIVNDLRLYDQMEAEALSEIAGLQERGSTLCARSLAAELAGDNATADCYYSRGRKLLDEARKKRLRLADLRVTMRRTESEIAHAL